MPTGFGLNRGRLQLTGLEEPDELWERLKEATAEAQAQAATNKKLVARVQMLQRKLSEVGALTDDELVAELPKRMTRAFESAQVVASEVVVRARKHEAAIRDKATQSAAQIVATAKNQAASMLNNASTEANAHIVSAEGKAQEIVRTAQARRQEILSDLRVEAETLQQRVDALRLYHDRLLHAYEVVERTVADARRALAGETPSPPVEVPAGNGGKRDAATRPPMVKSRSSGGASSLKLYDWSPAASSAG